MVIEEDKSDRYISGVDLHDLLMKEQDLTDSENEDNSVEDQISPSASAKNFLLKKWKMKMKMKPMIPSNSCGPRRILFLGVFQLFTKITYL